MKRKAKIQQRIRVTYMKQIDDHSLVNLHKQTTKQPSSHTKLSTNNTNHSMHLNSIHQKSRTKKQKLSIKQKSKQTNREKCFLSHKGNKKTKMIELSENRISQRNRSQQISYREYCVIGKNFIPFVNKEELKYIDDLLECTSSSYPTKCQYEGLTKRQKYKRNQMIDEGTTMEEMDGIIPIIPSISSIPSIPIVSVPPQYCSIGMQYSQRIKEVQIVEEIHRDKVHREEVHREETLSDLFLTLQFRHLPDETSFQNMSKCQKQHYSQLLSSLMQKMATSPRNKFTGPISKQEAISDLGKLEPSPRSMHIIDYQKVEMQIYKRQFQQMNWIDQPMIGGLCINTSLLSIVTYLCNLFCYIQLQNSDQFILMVGKTFGLRYTEKYNQITRNNCIKEKGQISVIDQYVFQQFNQELNEDNNTINNTHVNMHQRAIFDTMNEFFNYYRPFYQNNGECFPWSIKMFTTISEYAIDEDSIQIIFEQVKEKVIETASYLCGFIIPDEGKDRAQDHPLELKRKERQDRMIIAWLAEGNHQIPAIQVSATRVLHEVGEKIYENIIMEFVQEMGRIGQSNNCEL